MVRQRVVYAALEGTGAVPAGYLGGVGRRSEKGTIFISRLRFLNFLV